MIHTEVAFLNSARNALRCIIRSLEIKKLQVPYFTCPVVWDALGAESCDLIPYDLDDSFMPLCDDLDTPLLYTNYFGIFTENVNRLKEKFSSLVLDNAQAFYAPAAGIATFWSPRKFFGLPDGGIMWPRTIEAEALPLAQSWQRCSHLLKRWDLGARSAYADFQENDSSLKNEPPLSMSRLTRAMMSQIDYERVRKRRCENFRTVHKLIGSQNLIELNFEDVLNQGAVPMVYPYRTKDEKFRRRLIEKGIYVATYWPHEKDCACMSTACAQVFANEIIPLPIDQRYSEDDMCHVAESIHE